MAYPRGKYDLGVIEERMKSDNWWFDLRSELRLGWMWLWLGEPAETLQDVHLSASRAHVSGAGDYLDRFGLVVCAFLPLVLG
jgi:hypothetical protein